MFKPLWEPFRIVEALRSLQEVVDAARTKAEACNDKGLLRLIRLELIQVAERFVGQFNLKKEIEAKILTLRKSRDAGDIRLCYLLCKIGDLRHFLPTLHALPEVERLARAGMMDAEEKGKFGEWFKNYVYPPE